MLVLTRSIGQEIVIDGSIRVTVLGFQGNKIRLGIERPLSFVSIELKFIIAEAAPHTNRKLKRFTNAA